MSIVVAIDGSKYTKKALAFLLANREMVENTKLFLLNVQSPLPSTAAAALGKDAVRNYHEDEAQGSLSAAEKLLTKQGLAFKSQWVLGAPAAEIVRFAKKNKAHLIVMGTHGHGLLGRAVMGSVATKVVADADLPVLLVQ
jgi:nucleotide-binding universal stress UspA family protein